jgi:hypothetical protein
MLCMAAMVVYPLYCISFFKLQSSKQKTWQHLAAQNQFIYNSIPHYSGQFQLPTIGIRSIV